MYISISFPLYVETARKQKNFHYSRMIVDYNYSLLDTNKSRCNFQKTKYFLFLFSYVDYLSSNIFLTILHFSIFCWYWQDSNEIQKIYPTWISLYRWSVGTLKLRNNTFSQGKVHFYALFSHGKSICVKFF